METVRKIHMRWFTHEKILNTIVVKKNWKETHLFEKFQYNKQNQTNNTSFYETFKVLVCSILISKLF